MALSIIQTPAAVSLAQSPIIFAVSESNAAVLTSASFQYNADLYYWTGTTTQSGSAGDYTLVKYPIAYPIHLNNTVHAFLSPHKSLIATRLTDFQYCFETGGRRLVT